MTRWLLACALFALVLCFGGEPLRAQDTDAARSASARVLFEEGVAFTDKGRWAEAEDRFSRALALRASPVIRYNLANALVELGRLVEASELLREVERDASADADTRRQARGRLDAIKPKIARLTIQVAGDLNNAVIMLDDSAVLEAQLGVAVPLDPREHRVRAMRDGHEVDVQTVRLAEGAQKTVMIRTTHVATPSEAAATVPMGDPQGPAHEPPHGRDARKSRILWWSIAGGAVAVAAIAVISAVVVRNAREADSEAYAGDFDPPSVSVEVGR